MTNWLTEYENAYKTADYSMKANEDSNCNII